MSVVLPLRITVVGVIAAVCGPLLASFTVIEVAEIAVIGPSSSRVD